MLVDLLLKLLALFNLLLCQVFSLYLRGVCLILVSGPFSFELIELLGLSGALNIAFFLFRSHILQSLERFAWLGPVGLLKLAWSSFLGGIDRDNRIIISRHVLHVAATDHLLKFGLRGLCRLLLLLRLSVLTMRYCLPFFLALSSDLLRTILLTRARRLPAITSVLLSVLLLLTLLRLAIASIVFVIVRHLSKNKYS